MTSTPVLARTVELARMTHSEVERARSESKGVAVIPIGATEQHGPHLPMNTDTISTEATVLRAASDVGVTCRANHCLRQLSTKYWLSRNDQYSPGHSGRIRQRHLSQPRQARLRQACCGQRARRQPPLSGGSPGGGALRDRRSRRAGEMLGPRQSSRPARRPTVRGSCRETGNRIHARAGTTRCRYYGLCRGRAHC